MDNRPTFKNKTLDLLIAMINNDSFFAGKLFDKRGEGMTFEDQDILSKRWFYRIMSDLESYDLVENHRGKWYLTRPKGFMIAKMLRDGEA